MKSSQASLRRLAVHAHVQPDQHRPGLAEEDDVLHVDPGRLSARLHGRLLRQRVEDKHAKPEGNDQN